MVRQQRKQIIHRPTIGSMLSEHDQSSLKFFYLLYSKYSFPPNRPKLHTECQTLLSATSSIRRQPPRPQWQRLQLHSCRPYIRHESDDTDYHTHNVSDIISVSTDHAGSATVYAAVFFRFGDTGEGGSYEGPFEGGGVGRRVRGRITGGNSEGIDELEDEETREGAAEVGDATHVSLIWALGVAETYVARRVI